MSDLMSIQGQIEKLQKQANEIKAKEFDKTVAEIIAKMQAFGITVKDLQPAKRRGSAGGRGGKGVNGGRGGVKAGAKAVPSKRSTPSKNAGIPVAPKYRGPNGETWSGRGLMPRWLATLVANGQSKESFSIHTEPSSAPAA